MGGKLPGGPLRPLPLAYYERALQLAETRLAHAQITLALAQQRVAPSEPFIARCRHWVADCQYEVTRHTQLLHRAHPSATRRGEE